MQLSLALRLLGIILLVAGSAAIRRLTRDTSPSTPSALSTEHSALRTGPWPGLTGRGAGLLLAHALLLGGAEMLLLGEATVDMRAREPLPHLPLATLGAVLPLTLAARLTGMPGAASGVAGAYLLPRSLATLLVRSVAPPLLLLPATLLFDLALWLRRSDLSGASDLLPRPSRDRRATLRRAWRPRDSRPRTFTARRAAVAGALFGLTLALLEPGQALLLGGRPTAWTAEAVGAAASLCLLTGGAAGYLAGRRPR